MKWNGYIINLIGGLLISSSLCAQPISDVAVEVVHPAIHASQPMETTDMALQQPTVSCQDSAQHTIPDYVRRTENYRKFWYNLIPNQFTVQYAGSIGLMSFGAGWHYGKKERWETELLFGFVPKYNSEELKGTFTLKQRFIPWNIRISSRWAIEPLTTGIFFSSLFGEDFWDEEPSRYPKRYYGFSTKVRANAFVGQRATYKFPTKKRYFCNSVSVYYELSTCDMYIISAIPNKNVRFSDILSLAAGVRLDVF